MTCKPYDKIGNVYSFMASLNRDNFNEYALQEGK
jgi:hypothetical protein